MIILSAAGLSHSFGERLLLHDLHFSVSQGDRVGLVGRNGCGKTTLLKILSGQLEAENGVTRSKDVKIGYMDQYDLNASALTVYEEALQAFAELFALEEELERTAARIHAGETFLVNAQNALQETLFARGGLDFRARTRSLLLSLGFSEGDLALRAAKLSGGQAARLKLAKLLLAAPSLLLLDEPTNHLDIPGVEWLENFLRAYRGSVLVVSHDRYFLDVLTNRIWELAGGELLQYDGNYTAYLEKKAQAAGAAEKLYKHQQREAQRLSGVIDRQRSFNREKSVRAAESNEKRLARLHAQMRPPAREERRLRLSISGKESGEDVLALKGLRKAYPGKPLFSGVDLLVRRGEKAFILGPNACGKTTLFRLILGTAAPDEGEILFGKNVTVGYFDQTLSSLNPEHTLLDELVEAFPKKTVASLRTYLGSFLFRGDDVLKPIRALSGGERARLALLKILLGEPNLLLLDEPTNHLDIPSREAVEEALSAFPGAMLCITHDRYLIRRLADRMYLLTQDGLEILTQFDQLVKPAAVREKAAQKAYWAEKETEREKKLLLGRKTRLEQEIEQLERQLDEQTRILHEQSGSNYEKALERTAALEQLQARLEERMLEWAQLDDRLAEENV